MDPTRFMGIADTEKILSELSFVLFGYCTLAPVGMGIHCYEGQIDRNGSIPLVRDNTLRVKVDKLYISTYRYALTAKQTF